MYNKSDLLLIKPETKVEDGAVGGFAKQIVVFTNTESDTESKVEFLSKILNAVQIDLKNDTLFCPLDQDKIITVVDFLKSRHPQYCLAIGVRPAQLGLHLEVSLYQPFVLYGTTFLFTDTLTVLEPDRDKKSTLWAVLKSMFISPGA